MRKIIKSVIVFALMTIMSVVIIFSACSKTPEGNSGTTNNDTSLETPNNGVQHYEIELTKNNFDEFLLYTVTTPQYQTATSKGSFYEIKGVLSYAYYKDVTVLFYVEYKTSDGISETVYKGNFTVKLNAAGNYSFYTADPIVLNALNLSGYNRLAKDCLTITAVSGTVIFDI